MMTKVYKLMQVVFWDATMDKEWLFDWFHHFKEGQLSVKSDEHSGWSSVSRKEESVAQVHDLMQRDW